MDYASTILLQAIASRDMDAKLLDLLAQTEELMRQLMEHKTPELGNPLSLP